MEDLPPAVGSVPATTDRVVETVALANTTALLAGAGETAALAVLVHRVDNPVDARVAADSLVLRVDTNDLKVLVHAILVEPVRIKHTQVRHLATNAFLSQRTQRALGLELVHTLSHRLTVRGTLVGVLLTVTAAHTHAVNDVALLGLVTEAVSLVGTSWTRCTVHHIQLAVLPAANTQQETEHIALLLLVQLLKVLVGTHLQRLV